MNEHEKLETALDLLESYAHGNGIHRINERQICVTNLLDIQAVSFLEKCGRFRITGKSAVSTTGYWADEDPERKAGK